MTIQQIAIFMKDLTALSAYTVSFLTTVVLLSCRCDNIRLIAG